MKATVKQFRVITSSGSVYNVFARNQKEAKKMVLNQYLKGCAYTMSDLKASSSL
ncbi:TPA_asm: hypothetical protein [Porphyromonas phage phage017a_JCVISC001]|uniref:Transposase n=1 Tax=Porphyromonas phage phage017a_JCVISC001 TaxID=3154107 RepID=A0AAT9JCC2_9CAUD